MLGSDIFTRETYMKNTNIKISHQQSKVNYSSDDYFVFFVFMNFILEYKYLEIVADFFFSLS